MGNEEKEKSNGFFDYSSHALERARERDIEELPITELKRKKRNGSARIRLANNKRKAIILGQAVYLLNWEETKIITVMTLREYDKRIFEACHRSIYR